MKNLILTGILLLTLSILGMGQKIGNVDISALQEEKNSIDPEAHAAYLIKNATVFYDFNNRQGIMMMTEYRYRIKIYDSEGEDYANFSIPYYEDGRSREHVEKIKAVTLNLQNGKITKTKLGKKEIYTEETTENWRVKKFAMPDVKKGCIIDVSYTIRSPYIYSIPKWYFQEYVPVMSSEHKIMIPEYFTFNPVPSGAIPLDYSSKKDQMAKYVQSVYTLKGSDLPAFKKDKFILNDGDYRMGIKYELASVALPGRPLEYYSQNWEEISKRLHDSRLIGGAIKKKYKELNAVAAETQAMSSEQEKIQYLYNHIQTNYSWNNDYGRSSEQGLKDVIKSGSGNVAELNMLLINLLNKSGITAYPLLTKSRGSGLINVNFPTLTELNYLLTYIETSDGPLIIDASTQWIPMGQLPYRAINISGLLLQGDSGKIISMSNPNLYKMQTAGQYTIDVDENRMIGKSKRRRSAYAATKYRLDLENEEDADHEDDDGNQDDDFVEVNLENVYTVSEAKNIETIGKPINLGIDEELYTCTRVIGDKVFIDATLDFGVTQNPFIDSTRTYPVFYPYLVDVMNVAIITIPDGYEVESTPEKLLARTPNNEAAFSYEVNVQGNRLSINQSIKVNTDIVLPEAYRAVKQLYDMMYDKTKEKIILTKSL